MPTDFYNFNNSVFTQYVMHKSQELCWA